MGDRGVPLDLVGRIPQCLVVGMRLLQAIDVKADRDFDLSPGQRQGRWSEEHENLKGGPSGHARHHSATVRLDDAWRWKTI